MKNTIGKIILVIILLVAAVVGGAYAQKQFGIFKEEKVASEEETKIPNEVKEEVTMSNEDALKIGKEKYEYIRDGLFICGTTQIKTDNNFYSEKQLNLGTGTESIYSKITNIEEIKSNLTQHAYVNWFDLASVKKIGNMYYKNLSGCGENPQYAKNHYKMSVKDIKEDSIVYTVEEYFYIGDEQGINQDINKADKYTTTFTIVKDNNVWKINDYTHAERGYYFELQ